MAKFTPGTKKLAGSGRKPGTPNKKTQDLHEKARRLGVEPFDILLLIAKGDWKTLGYKYGSVTRADQGGETYEVDVVELSDRLKAASEACAYLYPKRKAVEHTGEMQHEVSVSQLTPEEMAKLRREQGYKK